MSKTSFNKIAGLIFAIIAVLHGARMVYGWQAVIGNVTIPVWISGVAFILAAFLAYTAFKK